MIPQSVYTHIMLATNVNHGAQLVHGKKTWSLKKGYSDGGCSVVEATLIIHPDSDNELPALAKMGYEISPTSGPHKALAWKDIPLRSVPSSESDEWDTWDEY